MNRDEHIVESYLNSLNLGNVEYEPDGKVPPDFLIDGRIAVEVRRLNQQRQIRGRPRGLEEDSIPLLQKIESLLKEFGNKGEATWFVTFNYRRPLLKWKELKPRINDALFEFLRSPVNEAWRIPVSERFSITTLRASEAHDRTFLLGGYTDMDAGGWIVSEIIRNMSAYLIDKTKKVAPYRSKYPIWWLVFVDHIGHAREEHEVRKHLVRPEEWDRILLLSPVDNCYYEI
jgi:hypothetical protein